MLNTVKRILNKTFNLLGYECHRIKGNEKTNFISRFINPPNKNSNDDPRDNVIKAFAIPDCDKIHYGCGHKIIKGWLNVDFHPNLINRTHTLSVNLVERHPFPENSFIFGFAEDFIEHLNQADSIVFLCEVFRTFRFGGVLRLSFPGLEGVLKKHYRDSDYEGAAAGKYEAYTLWDHLHFYSKEELSLVCRHIGFREVKFVDYGNSTFEELKGLDYRQEQIGTNTYAEIIK
jgi:predicted SAM-dependent methyltransferase